MHTSSVLLQHKQEEKSRHWLLKERNKRDILKYKSKYAVNKSNLNLNLPPMTRNHCNRWSTLQHEIQTETKLTDITSIKVKVK